MIGQYAGPFGYYVVKDEYLTLNYIDKLKEVVVNKGGDIDDIPWEAYKLRKKKSLGKSEQSNNDSESEGESDASYSTNDDDESMEYESCG